MCVIPGRGCACGVVGCGCGWSAGRPRMDVRSVEVVWEGPPEQVTALYVKTWCRVLTVSPSSSGHVKSAVNLPGPPGKPKYSV